MKYLLTDSRQLTSPYESIFFAIKGLHHDGHRYIDELYKKGVRHFVVETLPSPALPHDANVCQVPNTLVALQAMAQRHRETFSLPIIGITGSNGKTIVKEWLAQLLAKDYNIVRSPKSYNSQLGVPLSVWQINATHTLGIFEAGISQVGEMKKLASIIQPTIGIITNVGSAHNEGFANITQKIREKLLLFIHAKTLIFCKDHTNIAHEIETFLKPLNPSLQVIGWEKTALSLPSTSQVNEATLENIGHCLALMQWLGISQTEGYQRIQSLRPLAMRLELKEGINGCYLIDDSYNNDLGGLNIALNFLQNQHQRKHKVLILSDILQSGMDEASLYAHIAQLIKDKGVNQFIGIGETIIKHQHLFIPPAKFYASTHDFLSKMRSSDFLQSVILVKGARKFTFENIIQRLEHRSHGTVLEINLDAISHNLNYFREKLAPNTRIMVMVKAFAYGAGSAEVANLLQFHRVDYLAVAYPDEGVFLRENGIRLPIMVMNPSKDSFEKMIQYDLEPEIYSLKLLHSWIETLQRYPDKQVACHLKLDTGMHRLGFDTSDIPDLLGQLQNHANLSVASIFSHLAGADETALDDFTQHQVNQFIDMADTIERVLGYAPLRHLANSAGIARFPAAHLNMVRLGVGLYGVAVRPEDQANLQVVGTLKTVISQIKHLLAGETVGYGRKGEVAQAKTTATIAIGYADGYDRRFSRGIGKVWVNGRLCPVIGNVCMDMTMIDITGVPAQEGDEVVIFGTTPTIQDLAENIGTISYEILTNVSERVKRVFFSE
jgi:Alr-MurF fusion protein